MAQPAWLTLSFIIEEGFLISDLKKVVQSIAITAKEAGVEIVIGDTKVVEKGAGDGLYINTTAVGHLLPEVNLAVKRIKPGDLVLVSGSVGNHGATILNSRYFGSLNKIKSDCCPVHFFTLPLLTNLKQTVKWMRDPTRGGLATVLNELALAGQLTIEVEEALIPVAPQTQSLSEVLGVEPFYLASEGQFLAVVSQNAVALALNILKKLGLKKAALIGKICGKKETAEVILKTTTSSRRVLRYLAADSQPRIC